MVPLFFCTFTYLKQTEKCNTPLKEYWMTTNKMFKSFIKPLKERRWGRGEKNIWFSLKCQLCSTLARGIEAKGLNSPGGILMEMCKGKHHMQILEKLLAVKIKDDPN